MPLHNTNPRCTPFDPGTRVIDTRTHDESQVPGTIVESDDFMSTVQWDDGAGRLDDVFTHRLTVFKTTGSVS